MAHLVQTKELSGYLFVLLLIVGMAFVFRTDIARAFPSSVTTQATATASTTVSYLAGGTATSTYMITSQVFSSGKIANMQPIDSAAIFVTVIASSSASIFGYQIQYSNNNIDWYGEGSNLSVVSADVASTTNNPVQLATSTVTHLWKPGVAATSTMPVIILNNVPAQYARIVFFMPTGSAPGAVYAEINLKRLPNTP